MMTSLRTPIVTVISGEGGSGGALAIAVGDVVLALENAIYSVISPEGCASILWRTPDRAREAAVAMRLTAREQQALGVIDIVIPEPGEGAHADVPETARRLRDAIVAELESLVGRDLDGARRCPLRSLPCDGRLHDDRAPGPRAARAAPVVDRLRALLDSGRPVLAVGSGAPLTPMVTSSRTSPPGPDEVEAETVDEAVDAAEDVAVDVPCPSRRGAASRAVEDRA